MRLAYFVSVVENLIFKLVSGREIYDNTLYYIFIIGLLKCAIHVHVGGSLSRWSSENDRIVVLFSTLDLPYDNVHLLE